MGNSDDFSRSLDAFAKRVTDAANTDRVSLLELMAPTFIAENSDLETFEQLLAATGLSISTAEDFLAMPDELWSETVRKHTRFTSWEEMQSQALAAWMRRKVNG